MVRTLNALGDALLSKLLPGATAEAATCSFACAQNVQGCTFDYSQCRTSTGHRYCKYTSNCGEQGSFSGSCPC